MSHEVIWTARIVQLFQQTAKLTDLQKAVLQTRVAGMSIIQQSNYLSISERTVARIVQRLKMKYDAVQAQFPDQFKPRRTSVYETYLDTH